MIVLYGEHETLFGNQGLGALVDAISCTVTEELNGEYELEMEYPINGCHYDDILLRRIILAPPNTEDRPQPFRIYEISRPINGIITVNAQHLSYDLSNYIVDPGHDSQQRPLISPLVFTGVNNFFGTVTGKLAKDQTCPFTFGVNYQGQLDADNEMAVFTPSSIRSLMSDNDGCALSLWKSGEYKFDRFHVAFSNARGSNRGAIIRYGKNLTDLKQEENCAEFYTAIYPYWYQENDGLQWLGDYSSPLVQVSEVFPERTFDFERVLPVDLTSDISEQQEKDLDQSNDGRMPSQAFLRERALVYIKDNDLGVPKVNLDVSFLSLEDAGEYETLSNLENIALGDTVTVIFEKLGVSSTAKCIKTEYDSITERYTSIELGDAKAKLTKTLVDNDNSLSATMSIAQSAKEVADSTLIYDHVYEVSDNVATFEARLYRGGVDIHTQVPEENFLWYYKKSDDQSTYPITTTSSADNTGYTCTVDLVKMGYGGHVVGKYVGSEDSALLTHNDDNLTNVSNLNYTARTESGGSVRVSDLSVSTVILPTDKLMVVGTEDEHLVTVQTLADAVDKHYVHTQSVVADTWNINHNLNKFPSISVVDSAESQVEGEVEYVDANNVTLRFCGAFSGKAYLN